MATAQDVINAARRLINDETAATVSAKLWTDGELLDWVSDAQLAVVALKPEANKVTALFDVVAGVSRQRLSTATAYKLIRVECNGS